MEQHLYTYLNQKYGLKALIVEHASSIIRAGNKFEAQDNDVAVFVRMLRSVGPALCPNLSVLEPPQHIRCTPRCAPCGSSCASRSDATRCLLFFFFFFKSGSSRLLGRHRE